MKIQELSTVAEVWNFELRASWVVALAIVAITGSVLLLSAAGIYSMMSFTVTSRRREIGIRAALGAEPTECSRPSSGERPRSSAPESLQG